MTDQKGKSYSKKNVDEAILTFLEQRGSASAAEIAWASGISVKTVRTYISRLLDEGIVDPIGTLNSPKRRYRINR